MAKNKKPLPDPAEELDAPAPVSVEANKKDDGKKATPSDPVALTKRIGIKEKDTSPAKPVSISDRLARAFGE